MSLWQDSMETLVQVIVATVITLAIGIGLGIASARSDRFARALRPGLDVAQTMPSFVYLLPAFVLFDAGPVHGHRGRRHLRPAAGHPPGRRRDPRAFPRR